MHFGIIPGKRPNDAQFFSICLFQFSTCFEQPRAHHQENQIYQYNIWYMSLCVGYRLVCRSGRSFPTCTLDGHLHRVTYTRWCIDRIDSPDDEHGIARNMQRIEINTQKRIVCQIGHLPGMTLPSLSCFQFISQRKFSVSTILKLFGSKFLRNKAVHLRNKPASYLWKSHC